MEKQLTCFEVKTNYKSGRTRVETILSKNEETFWKYYDKHHNAKLIVDSVIVDAWPV